MIISQTPVRVSFLGGGSDYPDFFRREGGCTLAVALARYTYVTVSELTPFFSHRIGVHYSRVERVGSVDEIQHPSVRACLKHLGVDGGIEIHIASDLPARTGLGSSSSFTVGLLNALHTYKGECLSREELAAEAVHVEQDLIGERVGCQDQYACALGGIQRLDFLRDGSVRALPVTLSPTRLARLSQRLVLYYTSIQRTAHDVVEEQLARTRQGVCDRALAGLADLARAAAVFLADDGRDLDEFGEMLHQGWLLKKECSSRISTDSIDRWYAAARQAGAIGGKLLGAGGGGFLLLYVPAERTKAVKAALSELLCLPVTFDADGTRIIFRH